jgi:hypothetical protein
MQWKSPSTVLRRHKLDEFPLYLDWTVRGLIWVTSDALIEEWERRKVQTNQGARLKRPWKWRHKPTYQPYNWRLRSKNQTGIGAVRPPIGGGSGAGHARARVSEASQPPPAPAKKPCTCGTPEPCTAHD